MTAQSLKQLSGLYADQGNERVIQAMFYDPSGELFALGVDFITNFGFSKSDIIECFSPALKARNEKDQGNISLKCTTMKSGFDEVQIAIIQQKL